MKLVLLAMMAAACGRPASKAPPGPQPSTPPLQTPAASAPGVHSLALPGATADGVYMDYLAYDRARQRVWIPAGNTGSVDVIDATNEELTRITGFPTQEMERNGKKRVVGPSSVTIADRVAYVGSRGDFKVCEVDHIALKVGACVKLDAMPDGVAYVAATKEVWVTSPRDNTLVILDAASPGTLTVKTKFELAGQPEGYAVDDARGVFYTNLEDKDRTLAIDLKTHAVLHTWMPECGEDGPKGLALDHAANFLFVACADKVVLLDAGHDGKRLASLDTGDGVDNIDYVESRHELYAAASHAAKLTIAKVDAQGQLTTIATVPTAQGARNAVATEAGVAYVSDTPDGKMLVVTQPPAAK